VVEHRASHLFLHLFLHSKGTRISSRICFGISIPVIETVKNSPILCFYTWLLVGLILCRNFGVSYKTLFYFYVVGLMLRVGSAAKPRLFCLFLYGYIFFVHLGDGLLAINNRALVVSIARWSWVHSDISDPTHFIKFIKGLSSLFEEDGVYLVAGSLQE
jgi:hypothetical protein